MLLNDEKQMHKSNTKQQLENFHIQLEEGVTSTYRNSEQTTICHDQQSHSTLKEDVLGDVIHERSECRVMALCNKIQ